MATNLKSIYMYLICRVLCGLALVGASLSKVISRRKPRNLNSYPFANGYELRFFGSASE
jgi:hypothetical protein